MNHRHPSTQKEKPQGRKIFKNFTFIFFEISECVNKLQGRACLRWEICVWVYACVGNNRCERNTIKSAASKRRIGEAREKQRNLWKICVNFYWECIENIEHTLREKLCGCICMRHIIMKVCSVRGQCTCVCVSTAAVSAAVAAWAANSFLLPLSLSSFLLLLFAAYVFHVNDMQTQT